MTNPLPYYLGCQDWACRDWIGSVFHKQTDPSNLLREYSRIFNAVEGNAIYYALPPLSTVERWMAEAEPGFKFAPTFPKVISHERRLSGSEEETKAFLKILDALAHGEHLGVSHLQLPPSFNHNSLDTLESYLKSLPKGFSFAVEVRHISWYDEADNEKRLNDLLETLEMSKVIFDSRPLFAGEASDNEEKEARLKEPNVPIRKAAIGKYPMLRFLGRHNLDENEVWIKEWAPVINKWILEGKKPYIFAHAADDANAPYVARRLHQQIAKINPLLPKLSEFESDRIHPAKEHEQEQLDLF